MSYIYDKSGQRIFCQREGSTYGKAYDPEGELTAFTQVPADYPHWKRLDIIENTLNIDVPYIEKHKKYDISDLKHASAILSGNIQPTTITFDMNAQALEFLPMAVGIPAVTSHKQKIVQTIHCIAETDGVTENDYVLLDAIDSGGDVKHFMIWFNNGTGTAPTVTGINAVNKIEIDISVEDKSAAQIAALIETALEAKAEFTTCTVSGNDLEITTVTNAGAVIQARNGAASPGFTYTVATWGSTDYGIPESIDTILPSFTFHFEQLNTESGEDIIYDCFGCVVSSISINTTSGDQLSTCTVSLQCPHAVTGLRNTNNPPRRYIKGFPAMSSLKETPENYLIQEAGAYTGTTYSHQDRTPRTVDSVILTITNSIKFYGDIGYRYMVLATAGKREISLQIIGNTTENELFQYFLEAFTNDGSDWIPSSASGRLNSVYKLQRDATYDYILISFYNWQCMEHNFSFVSVDDAVKSVDMVFTDGSSDSNGRIIDDFDFVSYIDKTFMVV